MTGLRRAPLPMPGVVLGPYPQRAAGEKEGHLLTGLRALLDALPSRQRLLQRLEHHQPDPAAAHAALRVVGERTAVAVRRGDGTFAVQVAAGVMHNARRWLRAGSAMSDRALLVAGGAAGMAAAFNAPLAGIVFAIEELSNRLEARNNGLIIAAIVLAGLVGTSVFGNLTYFGSISVPTRSARSRRTNPVI